ncbi:MAG: hypothetical protein H0V82_04780 [Candidatus Protochlamydia sp.]|nr:hypothetical protein [Candidatus Protochlamydia sp.]
MNSLCLSNLQIKDDYSSFFDATLCGTDQNGRQIRALHLSVDDKLEPIITDNYPKGKIYKLKECDSFTREFIKLLDKNLIVFYNEKDMEIIAFSGFEKYGKISKNSKFCGQKLIERSYSRAGYSYDFMDNKLFVSSIKMLDYKTSESVKKSLLNIASLFDKSNGTSTKQYEVIHSNQIFNKISQNTHSILIPSINTTSQTTSVPSRTKALPTPPPKSASNSSSLINSNGSSNSFKSLSDFHGNNFDKDCETPPDLLIKTAIELAKKEGFTKFEISNSFKKNIDVYPEPYTSKTNATYHKVKVDFFIDASNGYGKSCQLVLQRQFFTCYSDKNVVIKKITDTANNILDLI